MAHSRSHSHSPAAHSPGEPAVGRRSEQRSATAAAAAAGVDAHGPQFSLAALGVVGGVSLSLPTVRRLRDVHTV